LKEKKRYKKLFRAFVLVLLVLSNNRMARAQTRPALEYQVKAAFLFNFTRFIHWPPSAYSSPDAPFVIGIVGNDPFGSYIDDLVSGELAEGHKILVRRYTDGSDPKGCHLVFINCSTPAQTKTTILQTGGQNILTVGDQDDFISMGGILRFYKQDNKIKMEIELAAAKAAELDISAKLLQLARVK
jgi:hypothetical protein